MFNLNWVGRLGFCEVRRHLQVLGLKRPTTTKQIKARYLELAKQLHPDSAGKSSADRFAEVTQAFQALKKLSEVQLSRESQPNHSEQEQQNNQRQTSETYEYFRARPRPSGNQQPKPHIPLWQSVPELFIGAAVMVVAMAELIYTTAKRKRQSQGRQVKDEKDPFSKLGVMRRYRIEDVAPYEHEM